MPYDLLINKIWKGALLSLACIIQIYYTASGKELFSNKRIEFTNLFVKVFYRIFLPVLFSAGIFIFLVKPVWDYYDVNKYNYHKTGTVTAVDKNTNGLRGKYREYTITMDGKMYWVPNSIFPYQVLQKGQTIEIRYFKHSRMIYDLDIIN